ncbi:hypothetical protein HYFRA_00004548 [Hymenoscyphus fraxineus]|uniref:Transcription factor CBF/NF-Y/archaeal histone domain-containing protein n=1 Tax=Hymenoscyphus fraxineus TaxID=746836 RepID=A0A9N9KXZ5_9HELO|nr:hypothetical protein HYFRA_00004548 [Hymenoscyphus fraxineus]
MPPNNAPIPPRKEPTGSPHLPLSRIKKMIMADTDIHICAASAAFTIAIATEMFIQYMAEQGHNVVKSEKKPRRNIQYRDLANAVSRLDNLEFLNDIVPKTIPYKEIKAKSTKETTTKAPSGTPVAGIVDVQSGPTQGTLDKLIGSNGTGAAPQNGNGPIVGGGSGGFSAINASANGHGNGAGKAREEEEREDDPNMQLAMESRRRESVNGGGQDVEMS